MFFSLPPWMRATATSPLYAQLGASQRATLPLYFGLKMSFQEVGGFQPFSLKILVLYISPIGDEAKKTPLFFGILKFGSTYLRFGIFAAGSGIQVLSTIPCHMI